MSAKLTSTRVPVPNGLHVATIEAGPRNAPSILFVHGIALSKRAFVPLLESPLAQTHRLVALDLRGHGDAAIPPPDAPVTRADYAADLGAVIAHLELDHPWLAGWSFGGAIVGAYLRQFGDGALGGILSLAGSVRTGREAAHMFGPSMMTYARPLLSEDPAIYEAACRGFVGAVTTVPFSRNETEALVADMLRVPSYVRRPLLAGNEDYVPDYAATRVPFATIHGALDNVVLPAMSDLADTARADVTSIRLPTAGHLPWREAPADFAAAVTSLVR